MKPSPNINLDEPGFCSYVLIRLFLDAARKFGRHKGVKSMDYNVVDGLTIVDTDDIVWSLGVNLEVKFPESLETLPNARIQDDSKAVMFCPECTFGIAEVAKACSVCEYLNKIQTGERNDAGRSSH